MRSRITACGLEILLDAREVSLPPGSEGLSITGLTADSREVGPGVLFAALPGTRVDGRRFIPDAVAAGAAAILTIADDDVPACGVPVVCAADPRRVLALAAARFYARQPDVTVAVTGTSGKTSVGGVHAPDLPGAGPSGGFGRDNRCREAGWWRLRIADDARSCGRWRGCCPNWPGKA